MIKTVSTDSIQDRATPQSLVDQIAQQFGVTFVIDLAASGDNKKCNYFIPECDNSLVSPWKTIISSVYKGLNNPCGFLNPPFKSVTPWMEKCKIESAKGCKIISLTLSSLGSNWYRDHVEGNALSLILRDRVTFDGCKDPFPKECMITLWGFQMTGLSFWSWKK
jgi:site-specific DNA-methyltransferase (adenine-specific)